jgi:hypothetical protein
MKRRDIVIASLMFLLCVGITSDIVRYQLTGNHLISLNRAKSTSVTSTKCAGEPVPSRPATADPQLKALAEYEQACQSAFASDVMIFTNMPISATEAEQNADALAVRLREFSAQGVTPIVIAEPDSSRGLIDFHEYAIGDYDEWNAAYFDRLKTDGLTDAQLGIWIPFPEPQQPTWNNNGNPDDFANSINRFFKIERSHFPAAKTAILLDSQVSEDNSTSQLLAYTRLVDNSLIDIAGIQGFPWHPISEGDPRKPITSASSFIPAKLLEQVAQSLGTHNVFINTGTYRHKLTDNGGELAVSTAEREATLDSIVDQVNTLRADHYNTTVNIFAQNKLETKEGTDWSYWQRGDYSSSRATSLFTHFVRQLKDKKVTISLYDERK